MNEVQPFLDEAFEFLRDSDDTYTEWQKFWNEKGIKEEELREAKKELINNKQMLNLNEDEKLQNSENIFCCDPFDEENVKNLLSIYRIRKKSEPNHPKNFSRLYHEFNTHLSNIHHHQNISNSNSQNNPNWISILFHPLVNVIVEIVGLFNPIFRSILKIIVDIIKLLLPSLVWQWVVQLFKNLWKKFVDIFAWIKELFQKNKKGIVFFVTILVMVSAIIGFSNLSTEKYQNDRIAELKAFNSNAKAILDKPKDIDSLEEALTVANKLKTHINSYYKDKSYYLSIFDKEYPNYPLYTLQQVINQTHEKNRFEYDKSRPIRTISFSSDGNLVALNTGGNTIQVRDLNSIKPFASKPKEQLDSCHSNSDISSLSFHPIDTNIIVTGASDGKICFLNLEKKEVDKTTNLPSEDKVKSITFSPKGNFLAVTQTGNQVTLISQKNPKDFPSWYPTKEPTFDLAFNQNEDKIATVSETGEINIWDYPKIDRETKLLKRTTINKFKLDEYEKERNSFLSIIFTENNELFIVSESKNILQVLKYSETILRTKANKISPIETIKLQSSKTDKTIRSGNFDLKNNRLITVDSNNLVQLWGLDKSKIGNAKPKVVRKYPSPVTKITLRDLSKFKSNDKNLSKNVSLIALHKDTTITTLSMELGDAKNLPKKVKDVAFAPDATKFAILNEKDDIDFCNLNPDCYESVRINNNIFLKTKNSFTRIAFNPKKQNVVAIGTKKGNIKLFNTENGNPFKKEPNPNGDSVKFIDFSPDGNLLVSIRDIIQIWDTSNLDSHDSTEMKEIQFEPEVELGGNITVSLGTNIALGTSRTKKIQLISLGFPTPETIKGGSIKTIQFDENKNGGVIGISFSKKNQLFFAPSSLENSQLTDNKLSTSNRPLLAAIDDTGSIKVWDSSSRKLIGDFQSNLKKINSFIVDSNGKEIFVGGSDGEKGEIEKWEISSLGKLIKDGCTWLEDYHKQHPEKKTFCPKTQ